jgi:hypothetical protein
MCHMRRTRAAEEVVAGEWSAGGPGKARQALERQPLRGRRSARNREGRLKWTEAPRGC